MIGVIATLKIQPGKAAEFESVFREMMAKVKANEGGCLAYQLTRSRSEPDTYKVLELYANSQAHEAHGQSEHFREMAPKLGPFLAAMPEIEVLDAIQ
jgi:quinol monooxygenase YgiN